MVGGVCAADRNVLSLLSLLPRLPLVPSIRFVGSVILTQRIFAP